MLLETNIYIFIVYVLFGSVFLTRYINGLKKIWLMLFWHTVLFSTGALINIMNEIVPSFPFYLKFISMALWAAGMVFLIYGAIKYRPMLVKKYVVEVEG